MPLRSARLTGDPILESCLEGGHRMFAGEDNLSVMRLQSALLDLGRPVGAAGADGIFGIETGNAVTAYKTAKGLLPNDPVVGVGTSQALDNDLLFEPPVLDPVFAEFSPFVVDHRLEQFVAQELSALIAAPLDSWRHMLGRSALQSLSSGFLLGIVAQSRAIDIRDKFLAVADAIQFDGTPAENFFDDSVILGGALGTTITFTVNGDPRAFIVLSDAVIMGRATIFRDSDGTRAPAPLQGVIVHELTHARNLANIVSLQQTPDTDITAFADPVLAQTLSAATGIRTSQVLRHFVSEITARHVHWAVLRELAGTPGGIALLQLEAARLAGAALLYFVEIRSVYDRNGYGLGIGAQGDAVRFRQLELWLRICANQIFSDVAADDQQSTLAFQAAADFCARQINGGVLDFAQEDGLFPLFQDFH